MTDYLHKDALPVGATVKITDGLYAGRTAKVANSPDWAPATSLDALWLNVGAEGPIWGFRAESIELIGVNQTFKYEVSAGSFSRTYDNEGKAIAVARVLRDYIRYNDDDDVVTLTKTPSFIVPEKVDF